MKQTIFTILLLQATLATALAQGFGEKFRSAQNRKAPQYGKCFCHPGFADPSDFNRDGEKDLVFICGDSTLGVLDTQTQQMLWGVNSSELPGEGNSDITFLGFYDFEGEGGTVYLLDVWEHAFHIINTEDNSVAFSLPDMRVLGVADIDGDNALDILCLDEVRKEIVAIGWKSQSGSATTIGKNNPERDVIPKDASGSGLSLKFESDRGMQLAFEKGRFRQMDNFDPNGDGVLDLALLSTNGLRNCVLGQMSLTTQIKGTSPRKRLCSWDVSKLS